MAIVDLRNVDIHDVKSGSFLFRECRMRGEDIAQRYAAKITASSPVEKMTLIAYTQGGNFAKFQEQILNGSRDIYYVPAYDLEALFIPSENANLGKKSGVCAIM